MMYKCCACGNLFEEGEQAVWYEPHGLDSPPYEKWDGCPVCRGDYEEVKPCSQCGDWHTDDELYCGWCEDCLRESIDYDSFFAYCEAHKDEQYLDIFVMSEFFGMDCPEHVSPEFHEMVLEAYRRKVSDAKLLGGKFDFLSACIRFIMDDDGSIGRENYADWLNKREAKK